MTDMRGWDKAPPHLSANTILFNYPNASYDIPVILAQCLQKEGSMQSLPFYLINTRSGSARAHRLRQVRRRSRLWASSLVSGSVLLCGSVFGVEVPLVKKAEVAALRSTWRPYANEEDFAEVAQANAAWLAALFAKRHSGAEFYDADALLIDDKAAVQSGTEAQAAHWTKLVSILNRETANPQLHFRLSPRKGVVLDLFSLRGSRGETYYVQNWWRRSASGWHKSAEAFGRAAGSREMDIWLKTLNASRGLWQALVDAKDPVQLSQSVYATQARYLRQYDGSRRLMCEQKGLAEEYSNYITKPGYFLRITPLSVAPVHGRLCFEIGNFVAGIPGQPKFQGLYYFVWVRDSEEEPWRILFETDLGEMEKRLPVISP